MCQDKLNAWAVLREADLAERKLAAKTPTRTKLLRLLW